MPSSTRAAPRSASTTSSTCSTRRAPPGFPKGVMLSSRNIVNNGEALGADARLHAGRSAVPVRAAVSLLRLRDRRARRLHARRLPLPVEAFDPRRVLETVHRERCTALYGVPTMFLAELEHPDFRAFDLTSLRTGVMAGALCPGAADAARDDRDAPAGDHHRLRPDRSVAGHHDDAARLRRSSSDRRRSASSCRSSR